MPRRILTGIMITLLLAALTSCALAFEYLPGWTVDEMGKPILRTQAQKEGIVWGGIAQEGGEMDGLALTVLGYSYAGSVLRVAVYAENLREDALLVLPEVFADQVPPEELDRSYYVILSSGEDWGGWGFSRWDTQVERGMYLIRTQMMRQDAPDAVEVSLEAMMYPVNQDGPGSWSYSQPLTFTAERTAGSEMHVFPVDIQLGKARVTEVRAEVTPFELVVTCAFESSDPEDAWNALGFLVTDAAGDALPAMHSVWWKPDGVEDEVKIEAPMESVMIVPADGVLPAELGLWFGGQGQQVWIDTEAGTVRIENRPRD